MSWHRPWIFLWYKHACPLSRAQPNAPFGMQPQIRDKWTFILNLHVLCSTDVFIFSRLAIDSRKGTSRPITSTCHVVRIKLTSARPTHVRKISDLQFSLFFFGLIIQRLLSTLFIYLSIYSISYEQFNYLTISGFFRFALVFFLRVCSVGWMEKEKRVTFTWRVRFQE